MQPATQGRPNLPALLTALGLAAGAVTAVVVARSDILVHPGTSGAVRAGFVVVNVAAGAYTWWRRPDSRFGLLFAGAGLLFAVTTLNALSAPVPFTLGSIAYAASVLAIVHVFLCYPRDRLAPALVRRLVAGLWILTAAIWALVLAFAVDLPVTGPFSDCADACPENPLRVVDGAAGAGRVFVALANGLLIAALLAATAVLLVRVRRAGPVARRTLAPLSIAMAATLLALAAYTFWRHALGERSPVLGAAVAVTILSLPVAIIAGQVRGRLFAARRLGSIVTEVGGAPVSAGGVQALVADALGDPGLVLARWDADAGGYVDMTGAPAGAGGPDGGRAVIELTRAGRPYALARYDAAVAQDPDVVRAVVAAAMMLLDNARLVEELRASRTRIAAATHAGRAAIERDLHDGAQPLLSALAIKLGLARDLASDPELRAMLDEAGDDTAAASEELRRLARGIYPPVLRERGAAAALRAFALTAPVAVAVTETGSGPASPTAEAAVYFSALEAVQNAIKHGGAGVRVAVALDHADGRLAFTVTDDGAGFDPAGAARGVGLTSMDDRVGALGGALDVLSAPGASTTVRGWVPAG